MGVELKELSADHPTGEQASTEQRIPAQRSRSAQTGHLPLQRFALFRSSDIKLVEEVIGRAFREASVRLTDPASKLDARFHTRRLHHSSVSYVRYGTGVTVSLAEPGSFYLVVVPMTGKGTIRCRENELEVHPGHAAVLSADHAITATFSSDCTQLLLRIEKTALGACLAQMSNAKLHDAIAFNPRMSLVSGYCRTWYWSLRNLVEELDWEDSMIHNPAFARRWEDELVTGLLLAQPHNYSAVLLGARDAAVSSRTVEMAIEIIDAQPMAKHTVTSLARQVGVTPRTLQKAFRRHIDVTPNSYLRDARLQRARNDLLVSQLDVCTVAEIAKRWGFVHAGRFSQIYKQRFGESPSDTLRA
ncbi:AraC family transcriptional regulator [Prauserella shujinwangii]|nr:AraC family transcriptional regulator [Prauserella shujinwangii]